MKEIFNLFDKDRDGKLSYNEFESGIKKLKIGSLVDMGDLEQERKPF